jgi:hypothetical protein
MLKKTLIDKLKISCLHSVIEYNKRDTCFCYKSPGNQKISDFKIPRQQEEVHFSEKDLGFQEIIDQT